MLRFLIRHKAFISATRFPLFPAGRPKRLAADAANRGELTADLIIHLIGLSLGLVGAVAILMTANSQHQPDMPSIVIYVIGLLSMLGLSAAYNIWPISRAKWVLRRFDHSGIYIMIAGPPPLRAGQITLICCCCITILSRRERAPPHCRAVRGDKGILRIAAKNRVGSSVVPRIKRELVAAE